MANITESEQWDDGVYQLETTDPVQGGADGVDNLPHKALANRTTWLKAAIEAVQNTISNLGTSFAALGGTATQRFKVANAVNDDEAVSFTQLKTLAGAKILGEVTNNSYRTIKKGSESLDLEISLGIPNSMDKKYLVEAFSRYSVSSSASDFNPTRLGLAIEMDSGNGWEVIYSQGEEAIEAGTLVMWGVNDIDGNELEMRGDLHIKDIIRLDEIIVPKNITNEHKIRIIGNTPDRIGFNSSAYKSTNDNAARLRVWEV
jgi:hypothetical protein